MIYFKQVKPLRNYGKTLQTLQRGVGTLQKL